MSQTQSHAQSSQSSFPLMDILMQHDPEVGQCVQSEIRRQQNQIELIASENFASLPVMMATGSVLTNKYAEGYPGRRYYGGCEFVDQVEMMAIDRACEIYGCSYANVQPHSGSQANQEVFMALMNPGDTFLGMSLDAGGHLTHGSKVNVSGKWFNPVAYGVVDETGLIDYDQVSELAHEHKPKVIIAGGSAYARIIDFKRFREIADEVGAYLMVDMAHFSGLVAGGQFPSPFPHAHVVTTTTHKTLRGPRGGMILWDEDDLAKKFNSAVFPGYQGGPLMHVIAAKAVAFGEALKPEFKDYTKQVVANAKAMAETLHENGIKTVTNGTDCHLVLVDLSDYEVNGHQIQESLERAGITCNKNGVPNDKLPPVKTSGVRIGTPAITTRGMKEPESQQIALWISQIVKANADGGASALEKDIFKQVTDLCKRFPLYPEM